MSAVDILSQCIRVERFTLRVISRKTILRVRNEEATIAGTLEGTKHSASCRRLAQSDIKVDFEGSSRIFNLFSERVTAIRLNNTFILVGKTDLGQSTTSNKESSGIRSRPILETVLDTVIGQL